MKEPNNEIDIDWQNYEAVISEEEKPKKKKREPYRKGRGKNARS